MTHQATNTVTPPETEIGSREYFLELKAEHEALRDQLIHELQTLQAHREDLIARANFQAGAVQALEEILAVL